MPAAAPVTPRLAAQTALANLFLDTSHTERDIAWLAGQLRETGLKVAELEQILRREVAPAFAFNLMSVAGEWQAWSPDEVARIVSRRMMLKRVLGQCGWRMVRADWMRVRAVLTA